ncbi:MAG: DUF4340 domain-containing protein [Bacteroidales bacterium]|nr:DUF4340 domain-containing protein [Bacteroidales bacterium]
MFKKLSFKILLIILGVLLVIYLITLLTDKSERTFKEIVLTVDTANVNTILIFPIGKDDVKITRWDTAWKVELDSINYNADKKMIKNIFTQLLNLKTDRVAATNESKWAEFEVDDSTGTRVILMENDDILTELLIGKFSYIPDENSSPEQPKGKMITYVRLADEDEVYAVEGYLKLNFNYDLNSYRNKAVVNAHRSHITKLTYTEPDKKSFVVTRTDDYNFLVDGAPVDSARTTSFIIRLSNTNSRDFYNEDFDFPPEPDYILKVEGDNFEPIIVNVYPADTVNKYIMTSSMNPGTKFSGGRTLFKKIFKDKDYFLPKKK